ncbi:DMT family transporter [Synergistaceae bacterium OttesenSCG-928-I11]|nr:DMT family transporter [Synergistaceae bacterium OttesenSCG-928-I11]
MEKNRLKVLLGDLMILVVAFIWGATNVVMRDALSDVTPLWFCGLRFLIASATVFLFFGRRAMRIPAQGKATSILTGSVFIMAYLVGAVALLYTTAGNQSFIISMSVVFVPVGVWVFTKKFPGWHIVLSVALCTAGMAGLVLDESFSVNYGDLLCFVSMLCVTAYILLVQKFVKDADPYALACWQAFGGMVLAVAAALVFEPLPTGIPLKGWLAIVYAGTIGFALTVVLQNVAQKYTTATHAAILLSTSSVFGSALGVLFIGEPMTMRIFLASALILAGVVAAEAIPALRKK